MQTRLSGSFENVDMAELCAARIKRNVNGVQRLVLSRTTNNTHDNLSGIMLHNSATGYVPVPVTEQTSDIDSSGKATLSVYCDSASRRAAQQQILSAGGSLHH